MKTILIGAAAALGFASLPALGAENLPAELETPSVHVIGTTPLPGIGTPLERVPANVQGMSDRALGTRHGPSVADALEEGFGGVTVGRSQGNSFQPDVTFRGFGASPLIGTPQGISVYLDGVRINEAFGDVVNWDLVPRIAIANTTVIPGSHSVFGLNTLGGALAIQTKSGFAYPGTALQAYGGAFGRRAFEFERGDSSGRRDYYVAGNLFREDGWRAHSSSDINQFFGKIGYEDDRDDLDVSVTLADTELSGTQALPLSMLDRPKQPYTWPDTTKNRLAFLNAKASRVIDASNIVVGNLYYRDLRTRAFNSNVNDDCATGPCAFNAANNTTAIDEDRIGMSAQYTHLAQLAGRDNQLAVGFNVDRGSTRFVGASQEANFVDDRRAAGISDFETETSVHARQLLLSAYVQDVLSLTERLHLTLSASANRAQVRIQDRSGTQPALNGEHTFFRINPAAGLAYSPRAGETWYASYGEGMRAPTPVELTCADPAAPCQLPNIFLADPPLKKVVSQTYELGVRRALGAATRASLALFRTDLRDDIQFISTSGATINAGFFQNVGQTRRQGLELGLDSAPATRLKLALRYSYVDATFRSAFTSFSPNNSSADGAGDIFVAAGNRIPGIPRQSLKLRIDYALSDQAGFGAALLAFDRQYARGDENNADRNGPVPGYAVLNLDGYWRFAPDWQFFASVANVFDRRYATFGVIGANFFTGPDNTFDASNVRSEQFRTPGTARAVWVGIKYEFGKTAKPGKT